MDEDSIQKAGVKPLLEILHQVTDMFHAQESGFDGGKPPMTKDSGDISDTVTYLRKLGVSALLSVGVGADDKDPDTVVIQASPPYSIGLPAKDYYENDAVVKKYEDTLQHIIENLQPGNILASLPTQGLAHDVIVLEKKLAAASPNAEDRDDVTVSLSLPSTAPRAESSQIAILQSDVTKGC
jgi:endothelin-converting enzyme